MADLIGHLQHGQGFRHDKGLVLGAEDAGDALDLVELLLLEFGVAAGDDDEGVRGELVGPAHQVAGFLLRRLRHRAGVDHVHVGHGVPRDDLQPVRDESALVGGRLRIVQLAAEGGKGDFHARIRNTHGLLPMVTGCSFQRAAGRVRMKASGWVMFAATVMSVLPEQVAARSARRASFR